MILHGIDAPNIKHFINGSLARPLSDYSEKDKVDIILTNPPFGGEEEDGIESNFPAHVRTKETADLFLVLIIKLLKNTGRCAMVLFFHSCFCIFDFTINKFFIFFCQLTRN